MSHQIWVIPLVALALAQVAVIATSVYLHRGLAHRALRLHPLADVCFRAVLWLTSGEPGDHPNVTRLHVRVLDELDPGSIGEGVSMRPCKSECIFRELGSERAGHAGELGGIDRAEVHGEPVGNDRSIGGAPPVTLHLALDPAKQLDRLQSSPKEPGRWPLEETFEEPLHSGEWAHA